MQLPAMVSSGMTKQSGLEISKSYRLLRLNSCSHNRSAVVVNYGGNIHRQHRLSACVDAVNNSQIDAFNGSIESGAQERIYYKDRIGNCLLDRFATLFIDCLDWNIQFFEN